MNIDQAALLVGETRAMYPGMTLVPGIVDAWLAVLRPHDIDDCRIALTTYAMTETRIPVPADIRRVLLSARQDNAMRTIPSGRGDLVPMPEWFHARAAQHKAAQREFNAERKARGLPASYGDTVMHPSDGRP